MKILTLLTEMCLPLTYSAQADSLDQCEASGRIV